MLLDDFERCGRGDPNMRSSCAVRLQGVGEDPEGATSNSWKLKATALTIWKLDETGMVCAIVPVFCFHLFSHCRSSSHRATAERISATSAFCV